MSDKTFVLNFKTCIICDFIKINIILGEIIIAEAQNVLLFTPVNEQKTGQSGVLFVTNFRLSFVTSNEKKIEVNLY